MLKHVVCDTGGSKTLLELIDEKGEIIKSFSLEGFGLSVDSLKDIPVLTEILSKIETPNKVKTVTVNLGGKNKEQIFNIFQKVFVNAKINVFRESEALASKALSEIYNSEVVVLAGTGAISCGFLGDGTTAVCGGWGMNIGDQGSGYYIGMEAIKRSLIELDAKEPLSLLAKTITGEEESIGSENDASKIATTRDRVRAKIYPLTRENVAKYAKTVLACAERNDRLSIEILTDAGKELGKLAVATAKKLKANKLNGIVFTGGVINSKKFIKDSIEEVIKESYGQVKIHYLTDGVIEGVRYIAKKTK